MATQTLEAKPATETEAGKTGPGGTGGDSRSLTQSDAPKPPEGSAADLLQQALAADKKAAEAAAAREAGGDVKVNLKELGIEVEAKPEEGKPDASTAADGSAVTTEDSGAESNGEGTQADGADDDESEDLSNVQRDEKGYLLMPEKRAKNLFRDRARLRQLESMIANLHVDSLAEKDEDGNAAPQNGEASSRAPVPSDFQQRIADAESELEKADTALDAANAEFSSADVKAPLLKRRREAISKLADARADARVAQSNSERVAQDWRRDVKQADVTHRQAREALFSQDQARFPELRDTKSPFYRLVAATLTNWVETGDPLILAEDSPRIAVEMCARRLGMKVPLVQATNGAKPVVKPKVVQPTESNAAVLRTSGKVVAGGGRSPLPKTSDEVFQQVLSLPQDKKRELLLNLTRQSQPAY